LKEADRHEIDNGKCQLSLNVTSDFHLKRLSCANFEGEFVATRPIEPCDKLVFALRHIELQGLIIFDPPHGAAIKN